MSNGIGRRSFLQLLGMGLGQAATLVQVANAEDRLSLERFREAERAAIEKHVAEFMDAYEVPGVSVAMARYGRLQLAAGFGWADRDAEIPVEPRHQFRIASVSKPITSMMIFRLIEDGQLQLTDRPFAEERLLASLLDELELPDEKRTQIQAIQIQHLLEHTSGGWGNKVHDPMFTWEALHLDHRELIRYTLETFPLLDEPGTTFRYSNFGYCVLGRVIEAVTTISYEQAVRKHLLQPAGVEQMTLGGRRKAERKPEEVCYYGQKGQKESPYARLMHVTRMDAHGGWIASPSQLVRLMLHVDGFDEPKDLLTANSIATMTTPSEVEPSYAKGWNVNEAGNWWHIGSFNGGAGILVRTSDRFCWAILVNTRSHEPEFTSDLDRLGWKIRRAVKRWPEV
ncbi:serine hydrolase domain-containing protein [Rubinisphaera margarita]|uniref:serine hydrolase domain-containing protein n=1 Tax=Rubinisphaera margarita TaxID=2909586 RepID=UPI001EE961BF|nr:serine hydrolase domain-containing protein [Rubinisphaera margarita]MCG6156901.1 beta-lactamase family protein [Rubinisphaera margarita]